MNLLTSQRDQFQRDLIHLPHKKRRVVLGLLLALIVLAIIDLFKANFLPSPVQTINLAVLIFAYGIAFVREPFWSLLGVVVWPLIVVGLAPGDVYLGLLNVPLFAIVASIILMVSLGTTAPSDLLNGFMRGRDVDNFGAISRAGLAKVIQDAKEGLLAININGEVIFANTPAELYVAVDHASDTVPSVLSWLLSDDVESLQSPLDNLLADASGEHCSERTLLGKDKQERRLEIRMTNSLEDPDIGAILICLVDITERNELAQELERLLEEERKRSSYLAALVESAATITRDLDPKTLVYEVARQMTVLMGVEACAISSYDQDSDAIELIREFAPAVWNYDPKWEQPFSLSENIVPQRVIKNLQPLQFRLDTNDNPRQFRDYMEEMQLQSILVLPLVVQDSAIGIAELMESRFPREYSVGEIVVVQSMANLAAIAIQHAQLFTQVQQQTDDLERKVQERTDALNQVVLAMTGRENRMVELKHVIDGLRAQLITHGLSPLADDPLAEWMDEA